MIIFDTNVLSEIVRVSPSPVVASWIASLVPSKTFTTSITKAELFYGIETMPIGRKREFLNKAATTMFEARFEGRVLPFDEDAAYAFAVICAARKRAGRPIGQLVCQIAAIARTRGAIVATRDVTDFADCGVELIDPWAA